MGLANKTRPCEELYLQVFFPLPQVFLPAFLIAVFIMVSPPLL